MRTIRIINGFGVVFIHKTVAVELLKTNVIQPIRMGPCVG